MIRCPSTTFYGEGQYIRYTLPNASAGANNAFIATKANACRTKDILQKVLAAPSPRLWYMPLVVRNSTEQLELWIQVLPDFAY